MLVVPAGKFDMGAADGEQERFEVPANLAGFEQPRHEVTIGKPFALAKFEVTRGEFAAFVKATNFHIAPGCVAPGEAVLGRRNAELSWQNPGFPQTDRDPVVCVNGPDINAYLGWLQKTTGKPYRLASEAEFEYAVRGGTTTPFYWGADADKVCEYENIGDQSAAEGFRQVGFAAMPCRDGFVQTAPVGSFKPNPFGLYDMLGNVWEITADCWAGNYVGAPNDGSARTGSDCGMHAARKGSFGNGRPAFFRAAHRFSEPVGIKRNRSGFRVALSLP
jgi:formylglycine-generating enzyme required for sulfatase activity